MSEPIQLAISGVVLLAAVLLVRRVVRATAAATRRAVDGHSPEDVLTIVAAVIATTVEADGMWNFFGKILHAPLYLRVESFAFLEVAVFVSGLRARRNIRETPEHTAGVDGAAVWVIAMVSGTLASTAAGSFRGVLLFMTAATVAAWLWERGLAGERRRARKKDRQEDRRINLRITPERILVKLRIAESTGRTASDVDTHRRLTLVARRAKRLRTLQALNAKPGRQERAQRRLDRAIDAAVEHAGLATNPARQAALMAQIATLYNAAALADLSPASPWDVPQERPTAPGLYRVPPSHPALEYVDEDLFPDTPEVLERWLEDAPDVPEPVPAGPIPGGQELGGEVRRQVWPRARGEVGGGVPEDVPDDDTEPADVPVGGDEEETQDPPADERPDDVPENVPAIDPEELERLVRKARRKFRKDLASGTTPSIGALKSALRIGQDKAKAVQGALSAPGTEREA